MTQPKLEEIVRGLMGDPAKAEEAMIAFSKTAQYVYSNWSQLVDSYNDKWIAVYDEKVQASAETLEGVIEAIDAINVPRSETIVRFVTTRPMNLIL